MWATREYSSKHIHGKKEFHTEVRAVRKIKQYNVTMTGSSSVFGGVVRKGLSNETPFELRCK